MRWARYYGAFGLAWFTALGALIGKKRCLGRNVVRNTNGWGDKLFADLRGDLVQHKVRYDTSITTILESISGPGLMDMISVCVETKIEATSEDVQQVKVIVEDCERR